MVTYLLFAVFELCLLLLDLLLELIFGLLVLFIHLSACSYKLPNLIL
jgi:hypothetical protein